MKPSEFYQKYEAEIIQVNQIRTIGRVLININKNDLVEPINVDEIIITKNRLKEVNKALNPYEFDYQKYLKKQGIFHQIRLKKEDFISLKSRYNTLKGLAFNFRGKINKELNKYNLSPEELAIINALLLGQRQDISDELFESYKNAGAIHILAVSGLHIGIILLFLNFLLKPIDRLNRGNVIKLVVIVSCLWTYAFIAGLSASVVYIYYVTKEILLYLHNEQISITSCLESIVESVKKRNKVKIEVSTTRDNWELNYPIH